MKLVPAFVMRAAGPLIEWLIRRAKRTPYSHLPGYMNRWWLLKVGRSGRYGQSGEYPVRGIRIHEILRPDKDPHPHDHPWPFVTFILKGGYTESRLRRDGSRACAMHDVHTYGPGTLLYRRADDFHSLVHVEPGTTTLFMTGRWVHHWGFLTPDGKIDWRTYLRGYKTSGVPSPVPPVLQPNRTIR